MRVIAEGKKQIDVKYNLGARFLTHTNELEDKSRREGYLKDNTKFLTQTMDGNVIY